MVKITHILILAALIGFVAFGGIAKSKQAFAELKTEGKNLKSFTKKKLDATKKQLEEIQKKKDEDKDKV